MPLKDVYHLEMKNLRIFLPLENGGSFPVKFEFSNGRELIDNFWPDVRPKPRSLCIEVLKEDGKAITITIPYDNRDKVSVRIED